MTDDLADASGPPAGLAPQPPSWRFAVRPKWLGWHAFIVASVVAMLWLGDWQLRRAESGNSLSWAYTFEWPLFAIFAVYFWVKTLRDERHPAAVTARGEGTSAIHDDGTPAGGAAAPAAVVQVDDEPRAALTGDEHLARLAREVKGHGRWHGLR